MAFLPHQSLADLAETVLGPKYDPKLVCECAYELTLGSPVFLTRSEQERIQELGKYKTPGVVDLKDKECVSIPPGKFALLLTQETVCIPDRYIGLISIKAKKKWSGLVNVSGFHVDPGFQGQLLFSVLNAGPTDIVLQRGEPYFMLFLAELTARTAKPYSKALTEGIPTDVLQAMSSPLASLQTLANDMSHLTSKIEDAKSASDSAKHRAEVSLGVAALSITLALGVVWAMLRTGGSTNSRLPDPAPITFSSTTINNSAIAPPIAAPAQAPLIPEKPAVPKKATPSKKLEK